VNLTPDNRLWLGVAAIVGFGLFSLSALGEATAPSVSVSASASAENAKVEGPGPENSAPKKPLPPVSAVSEGPEVTIRRLNSALIEIMKGAEAGIAYQARFEQVAPVVLETFDMPFMAAKSIGSYWRKLDADERRRWVKTFGDFTISNFADRFDGFSGQTFEIRGERPASRETRVVETLLNRPGDESVELDYRMSARVGSWRVVDIYSDGSVSEVALRRSEYSSVLKGGGIEELIAAVSAKTAKRAKN
jgi:phospholipid transport system substrate-binding protein